MSFRELFPWTHRLWRFLSLKPVRILAATLASLLVATILAFRVESFLFQQRVHSILSRMARIQFNRTSEQALRSLLPEFELSVRDPCVHDVGQSRRYSILVSDVDLGGLSSLVVSLGQHNRPVLTFLYLLGHRFHRFGASAETCAGKVVRLKYFIWIDDNRWHNMFEGTEVSVDGFSRDGWPYGPESSFTYEAVAPFLERVAGNAPQNVIHIMYTAEASADFVQSVFDLRLACLQKQAGCTSTKQLLPNIWPPRYAWRPQQF